MSTTTTQQPTVILTIEDSYLAFDERGEIIETNVLTTEGQPDWTQGTVADGRGAGGQDGFAALHQSLSLAETNARSVGYDVRRIPTDPRDTATV